MVDSFGALLKRTTRRRRIGLLILVVAGLATWFAWRKGPRLSPTESALVGEWRHAEPDLDIPSTRARGPMKHPWLVQEFAGDRTYRQWFVSGDDPADRVACVEGRWHVVGGAIRFTGDPSPVFRGISKARRWIKSASGLSLGHSTIPIDVTQDIPFRLLGRDDLELKFPHQTRDNWKRVLTAPRDEPDTAPLR